MTFYINNEATVWVRRPAPSAPLVVLMHGMGSNEDDLAALAPLVPAEYGVVSLRAPLGFGGGYAWFRPSDTPATPDAAEVMQAADAVFAWLDQNVPADHPVVPMGFSQGGAMVSQLLRMRPARFVGGVMMSGFLGSPAVDTDDEFTRAQLPIFIGRGDVDPIVPLERFTETAEWLHERSLLTEVVYNGMAHAVCQPEMTNIAHFLEYVISDENSAYQQFLSTQR